MEIKQSAIENIHKEIKDSDNERLKQYYKEFSEGNKDMATMLGAYKFLQWILKNK